MELLVLRIIGSVFLIIPVGGLFTGYFVERPVIASLQTIAYGVIFLNLWRVATAREAPETASRMSNDT